MSRHTPDGIDAFAGTGECAINLDGKTVRISGSAERALEVQPGFDDYYFIDIKAKHVKALNKLAQAYPGKRVEVLAGDGNARVSELHRTCDPRPTHRARHWAEPFYPQKMPPSDLPVWSGSGRCASVRAR